MRIDKHLFFCAFLHTFPENVNTTFSGACLPFRLLFTTPLKTEEVLKDLLRTDERYDTAGGAEGSSKRRKRAFRPNPRLHPRQSSPAKAVPSFRVGHYDERTMRFPFPLLRLRFLLWIGGFRTAFLRSWVKPLFLIVSGSSFLVLETLIFNRVFQFLFHHLDPSLRPVSNAL